MSHHASPLQVTRSSPTLDPVPPDSDTFDIFADVSHHGSSLFELLSIPSNTLGHPHQRQHSLSSPPKRPPQPPSTSLPAPVTPPPSASPYAASPPSAHDFAERPPAPLPLTAPTVPQFTSHELTSPPPPLTPSVPTSHAVPSPPPLTTAAPQPTPSPRRPPPPTSSATRTLNLASTTSLPPTPVITKHGAHKSSRSVSSVPLAHAAHKPPLRASHKNDSELTDASNDLIAQSLSAPSPLDAAAAATAAIAPNAAHMDDLRDASDAADDKLSVVLSPLPMPNPSSLSNSHANPASSMDLPLGPERGGKQTHNSHTRRCRAKVNSKFQELLRVLPAPPPNTGIKHKAQILEYTIRVFRDIHARKTLLEAELALSSRAQLNAWVESVVGRAVTLKDVLAPYLSLICTKGGWKYSEAWISSPDHVPLDIRAAVGVQAVSAHNAMPTPGSLAIGPNSKLRLGLAVIPSLGNTDDPDLQTKLEHFRDRSRPYGCKARVDLPGRIMCTMRPEWLPSLQDKEAFQRSRLATDASLVVCFGVPIFLRGHVAAVCLFFDTDMRPYDAKCVDLADNVAALVGNSFSASAVRRAQCR